MNVPPLQLVAMEVTRTCSLSCKHCRSDSHNESYPDELDIEEIKAVLDNIASFSKPIIIITGGEPLTRPDIFDIAEYSSSLGLRTVLATCGHLLSGKTVQKLLGSGISRISVSLDGASSATHDSFRGVPGAFDAAQRGIEAARSAGLDFQINSTLTTLNVKELEILHDLAVSLGAVSYHPFLLVPMGRGQELSEYALLPEEYEATLEKIAKISLRSPIEIKPTCGPHYSRIFRQVKRSVLKEAQTPEEKNRSKPHGHGSGMTRGCLGGQGFVFISNTGKVQICGFLEVEAGDLRKEMYDFKKIWETSPLFNDVRAKDNYPGKCGACEFWNVCGGCRARAYYQKGDYLEDEPNCIYIPKGAAI